MAGFLQRDDRYCKLLEKINQNPSTRRSVPAWRRKVSNSGVIGEVIACLDVGGTLMKGAVTDRTGAELGRIDRDTAAPAGPDATLATIEATVAELLDLVPADHRAVGIGVIVPGLVDPSAGLARYSANLGWRDVPLAQRIHDRFGLPVGIDHDVRAAGLAEARLGAAAGVRNALFLSVGTGVAGAVIVDGAVFAGPSGMSGEIGHVPVIPDGIACACGQRGCLEAYASASAVARRYGEASGELGARAEDVIALAQEGEEHARDVWDTALDTLGLALTMYVMLLDPELIVIGGGLANAGDALLTPLAERLSKSLAWREAPPIVRARFSSDAGRVGAALIGWAAVDGAS